MFNPTLALALDNLAVILSALGHREEALTVIEESVELCSPDLPPPSSSNSNSTGAQWLRYYGPEYRDDESIQG
jgi:hypothetical protein